MQRNLVRALLAFGGAVLAAIVLVTMTRQPTLVAVTVVKTAVAPGEALAPADLATHQVLAPVPGGTFAAPSTALGLIAQVPLEPGQTLVQQDVGRTYDGVPKGTVRIVLPVSTGQSAMVSQGERVDVLGEMQRSGGSPDTAVLATGVLVLATYGAQGAAPVSGAAEAAPQFVALALNAKELATITPYVMQSGSSAYWLVLDPAGAL